jgi:hypothetical protein
MQKYVTNAAVALQIVKIDELWRASHDETELDGGDTIFGVRSSELAG